jgi:hypothetical protein
MEVRWEGRRESLPAREVIADWLGVFDGVRADGGREEEEDGGGLEAELEGRQG